MGRCPNCQNWNCLIEEVIQPQRPQNAPVSFSAGTSPIHLKDVETAEILRTACGIPELERVLDYVHLTDVADRPIGGYSGGMKQRILIAQAILGDPKLLILDEPTAGLDPKERVRIREKIKAISAGKLILVSTHVVSDIQSIADQILLLKEGQLLAQDTVENLCQHYGTGSLEDVYLQLFEEDGHHEADWI